MTDLVLARMAPGAERGELNGVQFLSDPLVYSRRSSIELPLLVRFELGNHPSARVCGPKSSFALPRQHTIGLWVAGSM